MLLRRYPEARWHQYEPVNRDAMREGLDLAYGSTIDARYDLSRADVIVSLDADFLAVGAGGVRYARAFAAGRRLEGDATKMNRLYVVEATPTNTGARADHRLPLAPAEIEEVALRLAAEAGLEVGHGELSAEVERWVGAVWRDLVAHRGRSVVLAGEFQSPIVHALAQYLNHALGNVGAAVAYTDPVDAQPVVHRESLADLVADMNDGKVDTLFVLGGNPVYDAPADVDFGAALAKVESTFRLATHDDETSHLCLWHIPEAHALESWSDARAYDGTVTIVQPLIEPLYGGKTAHEIVAAMMGEPDRSGYDLVRAHWSKRSNRPDFEAFWRKSLHDGVVEGTAVAGRRPSPRWDLGVRIDRLRAGASRRKSAQGRNGGGNGNAPEKPRDGDIDVIFRPDPHAHDGRFANNAWLQELPKPITKLVWENAALIAPRTAERLGLTTDEVVEISLGGRSLEAPVWITPGHSEGTVTLHLGYGRRHAGRIGDGLGFDAYRLRTSETLWAAPGAGIRKTGARTRLATTQDHHSMEGRRLVRSTTLDVYRDHPDFVAEHHGIDENASLYPEYPYDGYAWGMTIDLNACVGCNACTIACQAENNIAVVGKQQVQAGREMHWIRVDRYFEGELDNPAVHHQPVTCMHCEKAPCEVVCPVNATVHSDEGLNDMVYTR
jgi:molybdopterin-containing oxidoreductase family iron-sulfur binding subunit